LTATATTWGTIALPLALVPLGLTLLALVAATRAASTVALAIAGTLTLVWLSGLGLVVGVLNTWMDILRLGAVLILW
jgi:hypothetical protein